MKKNVTKGITLGTLSVAILSMSIILILAVIKIYLSNQIYYESRDVNIIASEVAALKEENNILQINVEQIKYKSEVIDTIFSMDDTTDDTQQVKQTDLPDDKEKIDPRKKGSYDD